MAFNGFNAAPFVFDDNIQASPYNTGSFDASQPTVECSSYGGTMAGQHDMPTGFQQDLPTDQMQNAYVNVQQQYSDAMVGEGATASHMAFDPFDVFDFAAYASHSHNDNPAVSMTNTSFNEVPQAQHDYLIEQYGGANFASGNLVLETGAAADPSTFTQEGLAFGSRGSITQQRSFQSVLHSQNATTTHVPHIQNPFINQIQAPLPPRSAIPVPDLSYPPPVGNSEFGQGFNSIGRNPRTFSSIPSYDPFCHTTLRGAAPPFTPTQGTNNFGNWRSAQKKLTDNAINKSSKGKVNMRSPTAANMKQSDSSAGSPAMLSIISPNERADLESVDATKDDTLTDSEASPTPHKTHTPAISASSSSLITFQPLLPPPNAAQPAAASANVRQYPASLMIQSALAAANIPPTRTFTDASQARAGLFRRDQLNILNDDVHQVQQNQPYWVKEVMEAILEKGYKAAPLTKKNGTTQLTNAESEEWYRWQDDACKAIDSHLQQYEDYDRIEAKAWAVLEEVINVHIVGHRLIPMVVDEKSKCSTRLNKIIEIIKDIAIVRLDVLGNPNLYELAACPKAFADRKVANLWGNYRKKVGVADKGNKKAAARPRKNPTAAERKNNTKAEIKKKRQGQSASNVATTDTADEEDEEGEDVQKVDNEDVQSPGEGDVGVDGINYEDDEDMPDTSLATESDAAQSFCTPQKGRRSNKRARLAGASTV